MTSEPRLQPHDILGQHMIHGFIARGGMGEVYQADDLATESIVALKTIARELQEDGAFRERLSQEYSTWRRLDHPNILRVYDMRQDEIRGEDVLYLTMRYIDGSGVDGHADLGAVLAKEGPFPAPTALAILDQVADALTEIHAQDLVHADVKPGNILIDRGGGGLQNSHVYLTDFGLATRSGTPDGPADSHHVVGTPAYMAPELLRGEPGASRDPRADVYALGCVALEMLTGASPTGSPEGQPTEMAPGRDHHPPPSNTSTTRADLPGPVSEVIKRATAADPSRRTATPKKLVEELRAALIAKPSWWRRLTTATRRRWGALGRRGRWIAAGVATVLVVGVVAAVVAAVTADNWTTDNVAGISIRHPGDWRRQGPPDAAIFSPFDVEGLPPGGAADGWDHIIGTLQTNPQQIVGVYVRAHDEPAFQSSDLDTLKTAVAADFTGSRTSLQAPADANPQVAGEPAVTLDGDIRPWNSTDSLRIRSYLIPLNNTAGSTTVHVMFFASPPVFDESQSDFTKILDTISATQ